MLFTSEGRLNIKNKRFQQDSGPLDPQCSCLTCQRYSRAYLRHLMMAHEPLGGLLNTVHNLAFYFDTMHKVREELSVPMPASS